MPTPSPCGSDTGCISEGDGSLPDEGDLELANFSTRQLFIRTDLDRANNKLWTISGTITSLSVSSTPEPGKTALLFLALMSGILLRKRV